jgi:hypothetical protein
MDNQQAKLILSVYRPNGADAQDPVFREALNQAESDPALRAWFAAEQAADARIAAALAGVMAPAAGKVMIQTTAQPVRRGRRWWLLPMALAASVALALGVHGLLRGQRELRLPADAPLSQLATTLAEHHSSMGLMSADFSRLRAWIASRGGPLPDDLPPGLARMAVLGCQTWTTSRGRVSLVCFVGENRQVAHLYVFEQVPEELARGGLPGLEKPRIEQTEGWSLALWKSSGRGYVLGMSLQDGRPPDLESLFRA